MISLKPTTLLSPSGTDTATVGPTPTALEASKGRIQVGNGYSVPVKASTSLSLRLRTFTCQMVRTPYLAYQTIIF